MSPRLIRKGSSMTTCERQIDREAKATSLGVDRYFEELEKHKSMDTSVGLGPENRVVTRLMDRLIPEIKKQRAAAKKGLLGHGRNQDWWLPYALIRPAEMAFLTAKVVLTSADSVMTVRQAALKLGRLVETQIQLNETEHFLKTHPDDAPPETKAIQLAHRFRKNTSPKTYRRWLNKIKDTLTTQWDYAQALSIGDGLIHTLMDVSSDMVTIETERLARRGGIEQKDTIKMTDQLRADIKAAHNRAALGDPLLQPMVCPPKPWEQDDTGEWRGGYLKISTALVKTKTSSSMPSSRFNAIVSEDHVAGLNLIQATPWRINKMVLAVVTMAHDNGLGDLFGFTAPRPVPGRVDDETFAAMTQEEKYQLRTSRRSIHDHNASVRGREALLLRQIAMATELSEEAEIYFPHVLDFRGRAYPIPSDLTPQANDTARGLLTFARGKPLGKDGLRWLAIQTANTFGMDKETRDDQIAWVNTHMDQLIELTEDPLSSALLYEAEETWQFLAAVFELVAAVHSDDPEAFVSFLPVAIDGSNNGLQHLSAMSRDKRGGQATNLDGTVGERRDVYLEVLASVEDQLNQDAAAGIAPALAWQGHTHRKTVKRAVMTRPYGLTKHGAKDQLIKDTGVTANTAHGRVSDLDGTVAENAKYMRDLTWQGMQDVAGGADAVMEWLQAAADSMSRREKPVVWITPNGSKVVQWYRQMTRSQVRTIAGTGTATRRIPYITSNDLIDKRKQVSSVAPNVVHSFDAAHMMMTTVEAAAQGADSFAMIHDSFGTHAGSMGMVAQVTRQTFHTIYSEDQLRNLWETMRGFDENVPPPPPTGDYNIDTVLTSEYFFS